MFYLYFVTMNYAIIPHQKTINIMACGRFSTEIAQFYQITTIWTVFNCMCFWIVLQYIDFLFVLKIKPESISK